MIESGKLIVYYIDNLEKDINWCQDSNWNPWDEVISVSNFASGHFFQLWGNVKYCPLVEHFFRIQDGTYVVKFVFVMLIHKSASTLKILVFFNAADCASLHYKRSMLVMSCEHFSVCYYTMLTIALYYEN